MRKKIFRVSLIILLLTVAFNVSGKEDNSFTDESGSRITVKEPFKRIISLYGAHTENLFSLGLDLEIIGVSENEAYPPMRSILQWGMNGTHTIRRQKEFLKEEFPLISNKGITCKCM